MNRTLKKILAVFLSVILIFVFVAAGYVAYMLIAYKRVEDKLELQIRQKSDIAAVQCGTDYTLVTYNVGFGAYNPDFSFFMEGGEYARAQSKEIVMTDTNGTINDAKALNPDFLFVQEIDTKSTRSYKVNMLTLFDEAFAAFDRTYAVNLDTGFLVYPFHEPIGSMHSGIATYSKISIEKSMRYRLPVDQGIFARFFDLDRCFSINKIKVENGKYLSLINVHLSAYDEGGVYRAQQIEILRQYMNEEAAAGNYCIVGGDFNQDLIKDGGKTFSPNIPRQDWLQSLPEDFPPEHYSLAFANNAPTNRSSDLHYDKDKNFFTVIDGFFVSDNITVESVENIDLQFVYSDHNPVKLVFKLN